MSFYDSVKNERDHLSQRCISKKTLTFIYILFLFFSGWEILYLTSILYLQYEVAVKWFSSFWINLMIEKKLKKLEVQTEIVTRTKIIQRIRKVRPWTFYKKYSINCPFHLEINMLCVKFFFICERKNKGIGKLCNEFLIDCTITDEANER